MSRNQTSYKCAFCDKKFKGLAYLRKHIGNKHGDEFNDFKAAERLKVTATRPQTFKRNRAHPTRTSPDTHLLTRTVLCALGASTAGAGW